jgi:hypothetical protein
MASITVTEAQHRRVFFEKQLTSAKDKFAKAEQALKSSGIGSAILKVTPGAAIAPMATLKATIAAQEIKHLYARLPCRIGPRFQAGAN